MHSNDSMHGTCMSLVFNTVFRLHTIITTRRGAKQGGGGCGGLNPEFWMGGGGGLNTCQETITKYCAHTHRKSAALKRTYPGTRVVP